jgi:hypothetical protein
VTVEEFLGCDENISPELRRAAELVLGYAQLDALDRLVDASNRQRDEFDELIESDKCQWQRLTAIKDGINDIRATRIANEEKLKLINESLDQMEKSPLYW